MLPDAALALENAIEAQARCEEYQGDFILTGLTCLLGARGLEAQRLDAEQIAEDGLCPLVVALLERAGKTVTLLITTIALDAATLH